MFEYLIQKDKEILVFLNNLGSEQWDSFWLAITNQINWAPLFLFIIFLIIKTFGWKRGGFTILALILLVAFSDQFTNLIKNTTQRLRPTNDLEIQNFLRILIRPGSYSFMSGHATTSTFFSVFIVLLFKEKYKYIFLILLFPLVFAYSRLYLGVHFPIDIIVGHIIGTTFGYLYYLLFRKIDGKIFKTTI